MTVKSRWGYHPCNYELYRKLKSLNIIVQQCLRQAAAWERWHRKYPPNRRRFIGGKNGWEAAKKRDIPKQHRLYEAMAEPPYPSDQILKYAKTICEDYSNARTPVDIGAVKPLVLSEATIDALLKAVDQPAVVG